MQYSTDRLAQLLDEASNVEDPAERERFLRQACGTDVELRQEIERLLRNLWAAGGFLEQPLGLGQLLPTNGVANSPATEGESIVIEGFEAFQWIGRGAFGTVYRAEQCSPLKRTVAIKVLNAGMDSAEVVARFEIERQALALMDHEHIAKIFEAGTTDSGRPYFVMEYVAGVTITEHCDTRRLSNNERIGLIIDVCRGVQHAHQKGVIHRDLKPGNILVARQGATEVVKVIDFGIAKALSKPLTNRSLLTQAMQILGTPLYMSPEQADFSGLAVDTRSDVYSLGVVLFELLTGTTPFAKEKLSKASVDELRRIIREEEPPLPSQRLSTLNAGELSTIAEKRNVDARTMVHALKGEIDWIVMRALEKDPGRRYESPGALADDLMRYLAGEAVFASPPSKLYRLRKFGRRYRGGLTTAGLVLLALVATTLFAIRQAAQAQAHSERYRRLLYAGDMRLAFNAWQQNDIRRMQELLNRQIPSDGEVDLRGFDWHFLTKHGEVQSQVVLQSPGALYSVALSPKGVWVATAGAAGRIHIFSAKTLKMKAEFDARQKEVNGVSFSPDGSKLASCGDDGSVCVWDFTNGEELLRFTAHTDAVYNVHFSPAGDLLLTCGRHNDIRVWDATDGKAREPLDTHTGHVEAISVSKTGRLVAGSRDERTSTWELSSRQMLEKTYESPSDKVNSVIISEDGLIIAAGQDNGLLVLKSGGGDSRRFAKQRLPDDIRSLAMPGLQGDQRMTLLAVGDGQGSVHLLPIDEESAPTGIAASDAMLQRTRRWMAHSGRVHGMCFSRDSSRLFTVGQDGSAKAWELPERATYAWTLPVSASDFVEVGDGRVATAFVGVKVSSLATGNEEKTLWGRNAMARAVRYAPDGGKIVFKVGGSRRQVKSMNDDGSQLETLAEVPEGRKIGSYAFHKDGSHLVIEVNEEEGASNWLEFPLDPERARIPLKFDPSLLEYTSDGLLIFDQQQEICVVEPATSTRVQTLNGHRTSVRDLALSPDGTVLAAACDDRTLRVWDWRSNSELWSVVAHSIKTSCVAFSPDGDTLATCGDDNVIRLWRWKEKTLVLEYPMIDSRVRKMAFSRNGRQVITMGGGRLRIYDATPSSPQHTDLP